MHQKVAMMVRLFEKEAPKKTCYVVCVTEADLLPEGVDKYDFNAGRFLDRLLVAMLALLENGCFMCLCEALKEAVQDVLNDSHVACVDALHRSILLRRCDPPGAARLR